MEHGMAQQIISTNHDVEPTIIKLNKQHTAVTLHLSMDSNDNSVPSDIQLPIGLQLNLEDEELITAFDNMIARRGLSNIPSPQSMYSTCGPSTKLASESIASLPNSLIQYCSTELLIFLIGLLQNINERDSK
jgi:hypothetical protein